MLASDEIVLKMPSSVPKPVPEGAIGVGEKNPEKAKKIPIFSTTNSMYEEAH